VTLDLLVTADEIRAMASNGLLFTKDPYDRERYERLLVLAAEMASSASTLPAQAVLSAWRAESGYITPKVGVAAAVHDAAGRLLLIHRRDNGLWALPGGWADVGDTPAGAAMREVREETGLITRAERLLGVYDGRLHGYSRLTHLYHLVFAATIVGGQLQASAEVQGAAFFAADALPPLAPGHPTAIADAFAALADPDCPASFDPPPDWTPGGASSGHGLPPE